MYLEEPAGEACTDKPVAPLPRIGKETLISALVCAVICVVSVRAGLFVLFFLVPLGVCAVVFGPVAAWLGAVFAMLGNGVWLAGISLRYGGPSINSLNMLYFVVVILGFTWIMAGNPPESRWIPAIPRIRTLFRFIAASMAMALIYMGMTVLPGSEDGLRSQIEEVTSLFGMDAAQQAYREQMPDKIVEVIAAVMLRGGAVFSAFFMFFYNRQMVFIVARLFPRYNRRQSGDLIDFHAPHRAIGVLSLCLPVILLCRIVSLGMIEIVAWNVLVICVIMFLAQGGGIVLFNLARRPMPMVVRLLGIVAFVLVIFSPGINMLALTMLILLGIAENWLPLRVEKQEAPGV